MKRIDELEISPTPWEIAEPTGRTATVVSVVSDDVCMEVAPLVAEKDARLIATAPKLYKTEYELVEVLEQLLNGFAGTCDVPSQEEVVKALKASKVALEEAAGESEVNNG